MRYFRYHFRETLTRLVIMLVLAVLYQTMTITEEEGEIVLGAHLWISVVLALYMPILEFRVFNNRRNLDTWFSLPIDRSKLAMVHLLNGAFHITLVSAVSLFYLRAMTFLASGPRGTLTLFSYWVTTLLLTLLAYGFFSFVFTQANSTRDGTLFICDYALLPLMTSAFLLDRIGITGFKFRGMIWVLNATTRAFADDMRVSSSLFDLLLDYSYLNGDGTEFWIHLVLNCLICIGAIVLLFYLFNRKHTEKVEDISDSWFGFRTLIPAYALITVSKTESIQGFMFRIIFIFVAYIIYRRTVQLKKSDYIVIFLYGLLMLILSMTPGEPAWQGL